MTRKIAPLANTAQVMFCHDIEDSWYQLQCPKPELDGAYSSHKSIEKLATDNGWALKWYGPKRYNPWAKHKGTKMKTTVAIAAATLLTGCYQAVSSHDIEDATKICARRGTVVVEIRAHADGREWVDCSDRSSHPVTEQSLAYK